MRRRPTRRRPRHEDAASLAEPRRAGAFPMTESEPETTQPPPAPVLLKITAGTLTRALRLVRRMLGWLTVAYVGGVLAAMVAIEWWGERLWVFSVLLFAPPQMLLLPLLALTPLCLLFRPRLCLWHLGCVLVLAFGYMNFRWSGPSPRTGRTITVVTFNTGESSPPQFFGFIAREKPDFILLQDAGKISGTAVAARLPGFHVARAGEFALVSSLPIQKSALLAEPRWAGRPVAARFEVLVHERPLIFYSVHLPTPRQELSRFIGGRRILGDLVGRPHREPGFGNYREWLVLRIQLARDLRKVFADEQQPFIVGGDFNMPDHGCIYHLFADEMKDAFKQAGRGWGQTFPGGNGRYVRYFGQWLRLDYFFAGRGWRAVECRPEPGRISQHKAVLARFEPAPEK